MVHSLKTYPCYFDSVLNGEKTFEVRLNDRNYNVGDFLALNEYDPEKTKYTGRSLLVRVTYILDDEKFVKRGFVVLSIERFICCRATDKTLTRDLILGDERITFLQVISNFFP